MHYNPQPTSDLSTGTAWSKEADRDLRSAIKSGYRVQEIATYLCRTEQEVRDRASLLRIRLPEVRWPYRRRA